jgi:hypothetical protein
LLQQPLERIPLWIFFVREQGNLTFFDIIFLWGLLLAAMIAFWNTKPDSIP